jgi:hypothetical protein
MLWKLKDYVTAAVGIYEFVKYVIEHSDEELNYVIMFVTISTGVGLMAWAFVMSYILLIFIIFIPTGVLQFLISFISKPISHKISVAIDNTPVWVAWVLIAPALSFGFLAILGGFGSESGIPILVFLITGVPLLLALFYRLVLLFYRMCQFIQKKVETLTAE